MQNTFTDLWQRRRTDYNFKTLLAALGSFVVTVLFALYNSWLGIWRGSVWHGSISVYYLLLAVLRGTVLICEYRIRSLPKKRRKRIRSRVRLAVSAVLVLLNLSLFVPFTMLVMLVKPVSLGLIPAIAMAAYTTYKITMAIIHLRRRRISRDPLIKELRSINFIDALVSILTLQNTLIMVNDPEGGRGLLPVTASVTAIILLCIIAISLLHLIRAIRCVLRQKQSKNGPA